MNGATQHLVALLGGFLVIGLSLWAHHEINTRFEMALTHAHFTEALSLSKKNMKLASDSEADTQPRTTGEWIALFNQSARHAPMGGPAYVVSNQGNSMTGAIGVSATNYGESVELYRPGFKTLEPRKVTVSPGGLIHNNKST